MPRDHDKYVCRGFDFVGFQFVATQIFQAGEFKLHKLHSNCELESENANIKTVEESPEVIKKLDCSDTTYVKQQLGT